MRKSKKCRYVNKILRNRSFELVIGKSLKEWDCILKWNSPKSWKWVGKGFKQDGKVTLNINGVK